MASFNVFRKFLHSLRLRQPIIKPKSKQDYFRYRRPTDSHVVVKTLANRPSGTMFGSLFVPFRAKLFLFTLQRNEISVNSTYPMANKRGKQLVCTTETYKSVWRERLCVVNKVKSNTNLESKNVKTGSSVHDQCALSERPTSLVFRSEAPLFRWP